MLSLPVIKLTKINFPQSKIYLLAKKENIELANKVDFIDQFLEYKEEPNIYKSAFRLAKLFKKENIDCVVVLNPKKEFHLASLLAGVKQRIGYDRKWGFCLNSKIKDRKQEGNKHEVEYNLDLIRLLCTQIYAPEINLNSDSKDGLEFIKEELDIEKQYIVLHPFSSNPAKKIDKKFWEQLILGLKKQGREDIVVIGGSDEVKESIEFIKGLAVKNITGKLKISNLISFLKHNCSVFIGLDSGPMHLASALKKPVVGLFNISNAKRWGPFNTSSLIIESTTFKGFMQEIERIIKFACEN